MNNYELDEENSLNLILELMKLSDYYAYRYYNTDKLKTEKLHLLQSMKVSSHILPLIDETISNKTNEKNTVEMDALVKEANEHLN
tara:strand:- start:264 stop:518 length:255 start_codon:yes stop_codon:yes gene_type:complete